MPVARASLDLIVDEQGKPRGLYVNGHLAATSAGGMTTSEFLLSVLPLALGSRIAIIPDPISVWSGWLATMPLPKRRADLPLSALMRGQASRIFGNNNRG